MGQPHCCDHRDETGWQSGTTEFGDGDPVNSFVAEIDAAARCADHEETSPILDAQNAVDALKICEMQM